MDLTPLAAALGEPQGADHTFYLLHGLVLTVGYMAVHEFQAAQGRHPQGEL